MVTVVLEADGFADLLEQTEFMKRASAQDARIISRVRDAKVESIATAERLDRLEKRAEEVAKVIEAEVAEVAAVKGQLVERRDSWASARAGKSQLLGDTRADRQALEEHVAGLEREQAEVTARLAGSSAVAGPIRQGSGGLIWPPTARSRRRSARAGAAARRRRHPDARGHAAARRERPRGDRRLGRRLRQLHLHQQAARCPPATGTSRGSARRSASR